jgi:hypothetical protein
LNRRGVDADGLRRAGETTQASNNCTIRLIVLKDGGSAAARQFALEAFHRLGTTGEGIEQFRMVALDVPPAADLVRIRELLQHGESKGWWQWEEGCVTAAWTATDPGEGRPQQFRAARMTCSVFVTDASHLETLSAQIGPGLTQLGRSSHVCAGRAPCHSAST